MSGFVCWHRVSRMRWVRKTSYFSEWWCWLVVFQHFPVNRSIQSPRHEQWCRSTFSWSSEVAPLSNFFCATLFFSIIRLLLFSYSALQGQTFAVYRTEYKQHFLSSVATLFLILIVDEFNVCDLVNVTKYLNFFNSFVNK